VYATTITVKLKHVLQQVISHHWQNGKWWIMVSARVFNLIYLFYRHVYQKRRVGATGGIDLQQAIGISC
jgi:hypothetical protein